jgi:general secretion pathway protein F
MATFRYRALESGGRYETGRIDASDEADARRKIRAKGLQPVDVTGTSGNRSSGGQSNHRATPRGSVKRTNLDSLRLSRSKADKLTLAFLEKVYQLVDSGLPLGDAIKSLQQRLTHPTLFALSEELWRQLSEGATLASAMRKRPSLFDPTLVSMIEAGEATGNLKPILKNIIGLLESRIALRKEIAAGLAYPAFILGIVFFVMIFVLFYLMPRVEQMLDSMGGELSLAAKIVMGLANFSLTGGPVIIVLGVAVVTALFQWRKTEAGKLATDRFLLRTPVVRNILANAEISRFANLAAILLGSGVETTDALKLLEKGFRNEEMRLRFRNCRFQIADGASFASALQNEALLDDMDGDILGISENTGSLVQGFESIYRTRHAGLEDQMKRLTVVIATGALLLVFVFVFLLVFGIVSSIMQLSSEVLS